MRKVTKILIDQKGKKYFVKEIDNFHTSSGVVAKKDLASKKSKVFSSTGAAFTCVEPSFVDLRDNFSKGPQIILSKDIGVIIAKTGVNKNSKIVDAGGGSGSLALCLANICKEITVYENNSKHIDVLMKNLKLCGFKNVEVKQQNIYQGIGEKNLDLITLDLPEPWRVTEHAAKALKVGGFLAVYLPNLHQVKLFRDSTRRTDIKVLETIELIQREWNISDKTMRPEFQMLGHTGFLTFCRKL